MMRKPILLVMIITTIIAAVMMMNSCHGQATQPVVRPATQANRFYEGNPQRLSQEVDSFLSLHSGSTHYDNVAALIVPHAGY